MLERASRLTFPAASWRLRPAVSGFHNRSGYCRLRFGSSQSETGPRTIDGPAGSGHLFVNIRDSKMCFGNRPQQFVPGLLLAVAQARRATLSWAFAETDPRVSLAVSCFGAKNIGRSGPEYGCKAGISFRICGFWHEGYLTHQDLSLREVYAGNVPHVSRVRRCNCQKNLQNKAKKPFRINKSLRQWDKAKPSQAESESLVHLESLR